MKEFFLFIHKSTDSSQTLSPEVHHAFLKACESYIDTLIKKGNLISAKPIERSGAFLSMTIAGKKSETLDTSGEVTGRYYHIRAKDFDEACAIAWANPEFSYNANTRIEVRPIKTKETETGFVYPGK